MSGTDEDVSLAGSQQGDHMDADRSAPLLEGGCGSDVDDDGLVEYNEEDLDAADDEDELDEEEVDEDEDEDEDEEDEYERQDAITTTLLERLFGESMHRRMDHLPALPVDWDPLEGDLASQLMHSTNAAPPWHSFAGPQPSSASEDPRTKEGGKPADASGSEDGLHRAAADGGGSDSSAASSPPSTWRLQVDLEPSCWPANPRAGRPRRGHVRGVNTATMLAHRELSGGFSPAARRHITASRHLPFTPLRTVDSLPSRAYIGQFTKDGSMFVAAFQHRHVRVYDVQNDWRVMKDVQARLIRWTVTDTSMSPDGRILVYSSITPVVHLVNVASTLGFVDSIANITDIHEPLHVASSGEDDDARMGVGIWSVQWSNDGEQLIAGTSDHSLVIYDVERRKPAATTQCHEDDVNGVTYLDGVNLIATGSDDSTIKVWDRRVMTASPGGRGARKPVGVFIGHTEGVTHLDSKGDGRHFISNCKDQSIKLWDLRKCIEPSDWAMRRRRRPACVPNLRWDYRWQDYPARGRLVQHPDDCSLMTYRGHSVQATLIRAYFSPAATTAQRYIYTGSYDGGVHVFDVLTGREVAVLKHHNITVRDCSWHPDEPYLASVSWDGSVLVWGDDNASREGAPSDAGSDKFDGFY